jgi:hypothetical protein
MRKRDEEQAEGEALTSPMVNNHCCSLAFLKTNGPEDTRAASANNIR